MEDKQRLVEIETILMHQGQQIRDLEEALNLQRKDIESLSRRLERALAKLTEIDAAPGDKEPLSVTEQAARDKPPHY